MHGKRRAAPTGLLAERFELRTKLGEGGMGFVHRAWDRSLGKEVALKRAWRDVDTMRAQQLKAEFRARSALQHRNLVQLYELIVDSGDCFLTMELVDGTDLTAWVRAGVDAKPTEELPVTAETVVEGRGASPREGGAPKSGSAPSSGSSSSGSQTTEPIDAAGIARLRAALVELCTGLAVLHDAGIVHRDVTPANVRVTPSGRVVLLDFGLAGREKAESHGSGIVVAGTPRYMSPEQVRGEVTTAAADIYAVGGIVYELLTGKRAFPGNVRAIQVAKAAGERPAAIAGATLDEELATLAMAMLDPEPSARPDARAVVRALAGDKSAALPKAGVGDPFVGRDADVAAVRDALDRVRSEQRPRAMLVLGPSGIGKSTLIRHALSELGPALVLAARCHPQETIPFKALDAAMDTLASRARSFRSLGPFAPALAHAAVTLFPVLQAFDELGQHRALGTVSDAADLRALGFEAMRELFARLALSAPVVLWIDDAQWDDVDSSALLETLLRGRGAPPVLLLLSMRSDSDESAIVKALVEPRPTLAVERRTIGPLGDHDVQKLAATFLGETDARISRVVAQSDGNPFLACELARHLSTEAPMSSSSLGEGRLEVQGLVAARLRDLDAAERAMLVVTSMSVRPLTTACAIEAAHLGSEAQTSVLALRDALLVKQGASPWGETIAPYHDKIAEATQTLLSNGEKLAAHRAIAEALARHEGEDADALCVHWEGAGELALAATSAYRAAERASATLAFDRAAALYEKAIALGSRDVETAALLERAADAHANHGRGPVAASRYLDASRALGDDIADARVRVLKRKAAEQYVKSGYMRLGWGVMRSVLDAARVPQPATPAKATLASLGRRLQFIAKPIDIDSIGNRTVPEGERARLEILWTASTSMSMVNVTLSDAFRTQHLARILEVGDASSIARALAYEVALEAHVGGPLFDWHAKRLLAHARRLVDRTGDPYDRAWLELGVANQAFCAGRFRDAVAACRKSEKILREQCRGVSWEITTVAAFLLTSLAMLGDLPALTEAAERVAIDAERRGDLFGVAEGYSGECVLAWWCNGSGDEALARASVAVARQGADARGWPEKTYRRGELTEVMATVHLRLLADDPWPAWEMIVAHWDGMKSAMLPSLQFYKSWIRHGRARAALAAAETLGSGGGGGGWTRAKLLADVRKTLREMKKDTRPFAPPWAALVEAGVAFADGDRPHAVASLERALAGFDAAEMALYREAARVRLAALTGPKSRGDEAAAWMRAQGVPDPQALARALVPGVAPR